MRATATTGPMQRKPILMPATLITKVDRAAKERGVSFAEVVRDVLGAWDEQSPALDSHLVEALADQVIQTSKAVVAALDAVEQRLDETHKIIQEASDERQ